MNYEVQKITKSDGQIENYRVTHIATDSRVATCFDKDNAQMVCDALNKQNKCEIIVNLQITSLLPKKEFTAIHEAMARIVENVKIVP